MAEDTHSLKVRSFVPDTWNVRLWDKHLFRHFSGTHVGVGEGWFCCF